MKDILLSVKLYGAFAILLVLMAGMGLLAMSELSVSHEQTSDLSHGVVAKFAVMAKLRNSVSSYRRHELALLLPVGEDQRASFENTMRQKMADAGNNLVRYGRLAGVYPDAEKTRGEIESAWKKYLDKATEAEMARKNNDMAKATDLAMGPEAELFNKVITLIDQQEAEAENLAEQKTTLADDGYHSSRIKVLVTLLIFMVLGLALAWALIKNVLGQLGEDPGYLLAVSKEIAGGNLDVVFRPVRGQGGVYAVLVEMVKKLEEKIAEAHSKTHEAALEAENACKASLEAQDAKIQAEQSRRTGMLQAAEQLADVAEIISTASEQLSAQVDQSSKGTDLQARRVGETAVAMEEMNTTVLNVAKNASLASETSDAAKTKAEDGAKVVGQAVDYMGQLQQRTTELKDDMSKLGSQAEAIGRIMNVISDIADQTNLLALNAAIEAARAGDAGRGFAVVADEVRKLAEKTMTATKEVGQAIAGIQEGTRRNIGNVERAVGMIAQANSLASKSGDALGEIVNLVERTADQVRGIATAAEEQSASSEEINRAIEDINRISTETSHAMNQSAQAVAELAEQAVALKSLIDNMKSVEGGVSISAKALRAAKAAKLKALN